MNVRKVKHMSKRTVSALLSLLMVLSLFTVCMVGTATTVSAAFGSVTANLIGTAKEWNPVYLYVGKSDYYSRYTMGGNPPNFNITYGWDDATQFFVSGVDVGTEGSENIEDKWKQAGVGSGLCSASGSRTVDVYGGENDDSLYAKTKNAKVYFDNSKTKWNTVNLYYGGSGAAYKQSFTRIGNSDIWVGSAGNDDNYTSNLYGYFFTNGEWNSGSITERYNSLSGSERTSLVRDNIKDCTVVTTEDKNSKGIYPATGRAGEKAFRYYSVKDATVYFDPTNTTIGTADSKIYLYYGGSDENKVTVRIEMEKVTVDGKVLYKGTVGDYDSMCGYFFSTQKYNDISTKSINGLRNVQSGGSDFFTKATKIVTSNLVDTLLVRFDSSGNVVYDNVHDEEKYYYVNSTIYNYRSDRQTAQEGNVAKSPYPFQGLYSDEDHAFFSDYNKAVAGWYKDSYTGSGILAGYDDDGEAIYSHGTGDATPLYQGNMRRNEITDGDEKGTLTKAQRAISGEYHFISVANGANRKDGSASTHAVAEGLVDEEMHNNTITQNGVELPQFSDSFMTSSYAKNTDGNAVQWKSQTVSFPFNIKTSSYGNTEYYYAPMGGSKNRYYNGSDTMQIGKDVAGSNDSLNGYFPFNQVAESNKRSITNCYGTRFDIEFIMPEGGVMNGEPLKFLFEGDDDVWVYIDGHLALDMGGSHDNAKGWINFKDKTYCVTTGHYDGTYAENSGTAEKAGKTLATAYSESNPPTLNENIILTENKKHTLTVFYLERGEFDSNFKMEFMLPLASNLLTLSHDVDASEVNEGLLRETMKVANEDVFYTNLATQRMNKGNANTVKYPLNAAFTRTTPDGATTNTLQIANTSTTTVSTVSNEASGSGAYQNVTAYYEWTDTAKQLDVWGDLTKTRMAPNKGVGVPSSGNIPLLYGQTATFYSQFPDEASVPNSSNEWTHPLISFKEEGSLRKFTYNTANDSDGMPTVTTTTRKVDTYYRTSVAVAGAGVTNDDNDVVYNGDAGKELYIKSDHISIDYMHVIKTGEFTVSKELETGATDTDEEYTFKIEYQNLFGNGNTSTWTTAGGLKGASNATVGERTVGTNGRVGIKKGETITFKGIPVGTIVRVTEIIGSSDNYSVSKVVVINRTSSDNTISDTYSESGTTVANLHTQTDGTSFGVSGKVKNDSNEFVPKSADGSTKIDAMQDSAKWDYTVYNKTSTIPVMYRFVDRDVKNGKPTRMQSGFTYFTKEVPISFGDILDTSGTTPVLKGTDGKDGAELVDRYAPTIKNVLKDYARSSLTEEIIPNDDKQSERCQRFIVRDITADLSTLVSNDAAVVEADSVAYNDVLNRFIAKARSDANDANADYTALKPYLKKYFYYHDGNDKFYIVQETYSATTRHYTVKIDFYNADGTPGTKSHSYAFNEVVPINGITNNSNSSVKGVTAPNTITKDDKTLHFAYWVQKVTYNNGDTESTAWTPVSTNYAYCYRVVDNIELKAVYTDYSSNVTSDAKMYLAGESGTTGFISLDGQNFDFTYDNLKRKVRYYKVTSDGTKTYARKNSDGTMGAYDLPDTTPWDNSDLYVTEEEMTPVQENIGYCLPNDESSSGKRVGFDAMAGEKMYNPYSKNNKDYMRIDVVFGSVGSLDKDKKISHVGYLLFRGDKDGDNENYAGTSSFIENDMKAAIAGNLDSINNSEGKVSKNIGTVCGHTCLMGKMTVVGNNYNQNAGYDDYSNPKLGQINLTNKNRMDIVFDIVNNENTRKSKFTCYTYMIRKDYEGNDQIYISDKPATFSLTDPNPVVSGTTVASKKYTIAYESYAKTSGAPDTDYTRTEDFGYIRGNYVSGVNNKDITFKVKSLTAHDKGIFYKGKLTKIEVCSFDGGHTYNIADVSSLQNGGLTHKTFKVGTGTSYATDDWVIDNEAITTNADKGVIIKAYFTKERQGLALVKQTYTTTTRSDDSSGDNVYTTATVNVNGDTTNQVVPIEVDGNESVYTKVTITVTPGEGYEIYNKNGFILNADGTASKELSVNKNTDASALSSAVLNWPTVKEKTYKITVIANAGGSVAVSGAGTLSVSGGTSGTISNIGYWYLKTTKPTYTFTATPASGYNFNAGWSGDISGTTTPYNYQFTVPKDITVRANFQSNAKKIYFAMINQNWNNSFPRDCTSTSHWNFFGCTDINNNSMSSTVKNNYKWSEPHCKLWNSISDVRNMAFEGSYTATIGNDVKKAAVFSVTVTDEDFSNYNKLRFYGASESEGACNSMTFDSSCVGKVFYSNGGASAKFSCSSNNFTDWTRTSSQPSS